MSVESERQQLMDDACRFREKAESARTPALREYYRGRADGAQAAADALQRLVYTPTDNPFTDSDNQ